MRISLITGGECVRICYLIIFNNSISLGLFLWGLLKRIGIFPFMLFMRQAQIHEMMINDI